jgi:spermidine synthase
MKPWELLDRTTAPDGTSLRLMRRDGEYVIFAGSDGLMSSRTHGSEEAQARLACAHADTLDAPCILIGGLGLGFTLRASLDLLRPGASVIVAELLPAVVEWNRGPVGHLADHPLNDPRVRVRVGDVGEVLRTSPNTFDAILLDVDNGPHAMAATGNDALYSERGVAVARDALKPGGRLAVWSAADDRAFLRRLKRCGFDATSERVRNRRVARGGYDFIFLGRVPEGITVSRTSGGRRRGQSSRAR